MAILPPSIVNASPKANTQSSGSQPVLKTQTTNDSFNSFRPPNKSQPQYTVGGATRGNICSAEPKEKSEITAVVPQKEQSLTLKSHPSFFAYVSPMNEAKSATLVVKDKTEDHYYSQQLKIAASGGIVKIALAEDAPALEIGQDYIWFLRIHCDTDLKPEDPIISASITRVEGVASDINQNSSVYDTQIWYDSLNNAFELYQSGEDIYWSQLLTDIDMDRFIAR